MFILPPFGLCHHLDSATIWTLPPFGICNHLESAAIWTLPPGTSAPLPSPSSYAPAGGKKNLQILVG